MCIPFPIQPLTEALSQDTEYSMGIDHVCMGPLLVLGICPFSQDILHQQDIITQIVTIHDGVCNLHFVGNIIAFARMISNTSPLINPEPHSSPKDSLEQP